MADEIENTLASFALAGLVPSEETIDLACKVKAGELTTDEAVKIILDKYSTREWISPIGSTHEQGRARRRENPEYRQLEIDGEEHDTRSN